MDLTYIGKITFKRFCFIGRYGDFHVDNENDNSSIGERTTNNYEQYPVCNGYVIISELTDVLKSGNLESPLGYINVDWFLVQVIELEKNGFRF